MLSSDKLFEICGNTWESLIDAGNIHEAILTGMSANQVLHARNEPKLASGALAQVQVAIAGKVRSAGERSRESACSFCGASEPDVELACGPTVEICNVCARSFARVFDIRK